MRIVTKLVFEPGDLTVKKIDYAFRQVGGQAWDQEDPRAKPFRRIRGNDATLEDCRQAASIVRAEAAQLRQKAQTAPCPFPEMEEGSTRIEDTWREGELHGADRAVRLAEDFLEYIEAAWMAAHAC